ncbi:MAG: preprotein translocase subunit SecA, partial [Chloroflexota bacterium]|nr:preprotein translocase subunit SecA [Chloroflexota bacterium]
MFKWLTNLLDSNEKELKRLHTVVEDINSLEPDFEGLSDIALRAKTDEFKKRHSDGESLDSLLPEAFAAVREAAKRTLGQRHFDVQLMGGIVLHQGKIAEMRTGEGKTLVATLPLYLNSLTGDGCHLVTVNDYLAKRDPYWMGPIYNLLGVSVACVQHEVSYLYNPEHESEDEKWNWLQPISRCDAYKADITYGTNNEFGFDYLRDNLVPELSRCVQRGYNYAIVDEVDNILIDEARTPLIISGPAREASNKYQAFTKIIPNLVKDEDYTIADKEKAVTLTEEGTTKVEKLLRSEGLLKAPNIYDPSNYSLTNYLQSALRAHIMFKRDRDYVVKDGQVIIVDEFTGRLMPGRRYSEGLHQALEAKEGVRVQQESMTLASITFQNYFRMYKKLAGMTGTAVTEAEEFHRIYKLDVVVIPTNRPMIRLEHSDLVYKNEEAKFRAVADEVAELHEKQCPVLVGTVSIEKSELISEMLKRNGIRHQVLNAKNHEKEAAIIAQAGRMSAVTIATNMAGRGVDIILGGMEDGRDEKAREEEHERVVELGGLHVIGTERHEARRIDNQLRGRAGRQGDPGSSRFYVSLEDDVMRRFGGDRVKGLMEWAKLDEDTPIEHSMVNRAIEGAQVKVEGYHFDLRKHLVDYDDVVSKQREVIYGERRKILEGIDLKTNIQNMVREELQGLVDSCQTDGIIDAESLLKEVGMIFPIPANMTAVSISEMDLDEIIDKLDQHALAFYEEREQKVGAQDM